MSYVQQPAYCTRLSNSNHSKPWLAASVQLDTILAYPIPVSRLAGQTNICLLSEHAALLQLRHAHMRTITEPP
jgi:hypothetical protein